jgi:hypothetical protein
MIDTLNDEERKAYSLLSTLFLDGDLTDEGLDLTASALQRFGIPLPRLELVMLTGYPRVIFS